MTQYRITLKFSDDGTDWLFFETESTDHEEIKRLAIVEVIRDHEEGKASKLLNGDPEQARRTITIRETYRGMLVKGGLTLKTKWR